jgi:hypothetical protein
MGGKIKNPIIYSYFSQFSNYNTFVDTFGGRTIFAYSSEMFMNDTFPLYKMLDVPEFYGRYDSTVQIPAQLMWTYIKSLVEDKKSKTMLDEAILQGKIWYILKQIFPQSPEGILFGYSEAEWKLLTNVAYEGQIWKHYLDNNALFETDFNKYKRYFTMGNKTFGSGIAENCPPLIGNFTGYRIVSEFMKKEKLNFSALLKENDAGKILQISAYNPVK